MSRLDYCQFLLSSQVNYTLTYFADHWQKWSHDTINRYLAGDKVTARMVWDNVKDDIILDEEGYLLFDDTVLDKNYSRDIEPVRRQYSGNEKRVIRGIGLVSCVYVNAKLNRFWVIDYRIYAPDRDGKTKLDHVEQMIERTILHKRLPFRVALMDTWYATMPIFKLLERHDKIYYCTLQSNRKVSTSPESGYQRVDSLTWSDQQHKTGQLIHLHGMPRGHQVKLFRIVFSSERTDLIITNDLTQGSADATQEEWSIRWKIEQFHREVKQNTGIERCQCRKERIQRNHIGCALLVWVRLKALADQMETTIYALKENLLADYMIQQLRNPSLKMALA